MTKLPYGNPNRALVAILCASLAGSAVSASAEEGYTDLLAGNALADTWRGFQKDYTPAGWSLEGGVLNGAGGGDLVTREEFADFELRFDWKIEPGGNSGVIYRVSEEGTHAHDSGYEYQVLDPKYPEATELNGPASLYALYPAPLSATKPAGEWNTGRVVVRDGTIEHWVNGQRVVSADTGSDDWKRCLAASKFADWPHFAKNEAGHLALQDHGASVWYRNLRVKRLDGSSAE